ncbi:MAG: DEAD/DEAH box helicase family protein [Selenomonadaceae bacterium]|nr:DEAD/DEAH box helicase family protein [Selenomonadaceae bacterium]
MFLYKKLETLREYGNIAAVSEYVSKNLNPAFELRSYQVQAFENFITHFESKKCPHPLQVLFHMATGSGKTLIMAGLMLYLYKQGYRNFLFFVNLTNIIDKTRENFLNADSSKYLFAEEIVIEGEKIKINVVENFQSVDDDAINICFDTTQGLHTKMFFAQENAMTLDDFDDKKIVFISDESHHLNADTKNAAGKKDNVNTWEQTVKHIFNRNAENILLEFTATCDVKNPAISMEYEDKIIFDYPLQKFYNDKYSKDIMTLRSDFPAMEKVLQAIILSQYRLKVFQDHKLNIKPIVLFKSAKIADSQNFMAEFIETVKTLNGNYLQSLFQIFDNEIMKRAFEYFERNGISLENLAAELRDDFSEEHCISVNDEKENENNQFKLNSLESPDNPYRAIFEVKKLDEGWDVLNLFDIVRLYETRQSGGKKISATTISEAQLIGRGARYCPFQISNEQPKFQRKYDSDVNCELRICETLYYHCQNDSRYINELKAALREIGLYADKIIKRQYTLKESFKKDDLYKSGIIFLNERVEKSCSLPEEIAPEVRDKIYSVTMNLGISGESRMMTDDAEKVSRVEIYTTSYTIKEIAAINFAIVNKALMKYPVYKFENLKTCFKVLKSTRDFIIDEKFLGNVKISIKSRTENLSANDLYLAVSKVLGEISSVIAKPNIEYEGTKEFSSHNISDIFKDTTVNYSVTHEGGLGVSQNDSSVDEDCRIDLSLEDWFAYTDNFGTVEEKALVAYFRDRITKLKKIYSKIFLVRNERQFHIYSFETGERFEPDYVLFLQKNKESHFEQLQIFIEPKGEHLLQKDEWKEKFLLQMKENAIPMVDEKKYSIWGLPFFNRGDSFKEFDDEFIFIEK